MQKQNNIPISEKVNISVDEAAEIASVGRNKIYQLMKEPDCNFVLYVGKRKRVIRKEEFLAYLRTHEQI